MAAPVLATQASALLVTTLLLLVQGPRGAGATDRNSKSYGWLGPERSRFCQSATQLPPKLDESADYPKTDFETQENHGTRLLVQEWRSAELFQPVMQQCALVGESAEGSSTCSAALQTYATSFSMAMLALPMLGAILAACVWQVCCWVAFCRCCRRCCLCQERKGPYPAKTLQKIAVGVVGFVTTVVIFSMAVVAYTRSETVSGGIADVLCQLLSMSDEALNGSGSGPTFLGVDVGIQRMHMLRQLLDVDGRAMTDVRAILDETATFATSTDLLLTKISHMQRVLTLVGQHKVKDHTCWFCQRAIGSNTTGEVGLLVQLQQEIQQSSAATMRSIQEAASSTLTGKALVQVSTAVQRGGIALEIFKRGFGGAFVDAVLSHRHTIEMVEDARHTIFQCICAFCIVHVLIVQNVAIAYARRSKAKYPTDKPSCVTWFCGFCSLSSALLFAGTLLLTAVPLSESCSFWRRNLMTYDGIADYYLQMGLYNPSDGSKQMDPLAVDVWRTCLTPNGTGEILQALNLQESLEFQQTLQSGFDELEQTSNNLVDAELYDLLVQEAGDYGGLFLLFPDSPLELSPDQASRMIGSSLDADDQKGPDGETWIYGLNTFAGLIAGTGLYTFKHGTSGPGTLITASTPTEAEVSSQALVVQNALTYARQKEQILSEPAIFRCDTLNSNLQVTEQMCSYEEYKSAVLGWAQEIRAAGLQLGEQVQLAETLINDELKNSLGDVLKEVKDMRSDLRCRFLWRRWEDLDFTLCNRALPGIIEGAFAWGVLAAFTLALAVLHYKIWRHLLDNKVVGDELEKFSKKYGYLQAS
jgi:hypothetical protein